MQSSQHSKSSASQDAKVELHDLFHINDLDDIILEYADGEVDSKNYAVNPQNQNLFFSVSLPVSALLRHVIRGEQAEAEAMLKKNPALLLEKGKVTDYSGRTIQGTAFQLALGAEDAEMCEMIAPYFAEVKEGLYSMI